MAARTSSKMFCAEANAISTRYTFRWWWWRRGGEASSTAELREQILGRFGRRRHAEYALPGTRLLKCHDRASPRRTPGRQPVDDRLSFDGRDWRRALPYYFRAIDFGFRWWRGMSQFHGGAFAIKPTAAKFYSLSSGIYHRAGRLALRNDKELALNKNAKRKYKAASSRWWWYDNTFSGDNRRSANLPFHTLRLWCPGMIFAEYKAQLRSARGFYRALL